MALKDKRNKRNRAMRKANNTVSEDTSVNLSRVQNDAWRQLHQDARDLIVKARTEEIKLEREKKNDNDTPPSASATVHTLWPARLPLPSKWLAITA